MELNQFIKTVKIDRDIDNNILLFKKLFNIETNIQLARAPGRINIIGEHVDYCGYSVFPMAIKNDIFMIFHSASNGPQLSLRNINEKFKPFDIDFSAEELTINSNTPNWHDYFLCGYKGILDFANENNLKLKNISLSVLVDGSILPNSGLSSSSALVVCSAMVTMKAFDLNIPKKTLASLCASCERYIGTLGGGMDQFISIMAEQNSAMLINFGATEILSESISLPKDSVFIVSNSRQQMNKAASNQFNQRVVESRLAAKLLLKLMQPESSEFRNIHRLSDVQRLLNLDNCTMSNRIDELLKEKYSRETVLQLLQLSDEEFSSMILSRNTTEMNEFHLLRRAKHVIEEVGRVAEFRETCLSTTISDEEKLQTLGKLMNESQASLAELYECSSEILDQLVDTCRKAGAYGSRLTGAGWGGCVISLVAHQKVNEFLNSVAQNFYNAGIEDVLNEMFVTSPSGGATFLVLD